MQIKQNIDFIQLFLLLRDTSCKRVHEFTSRPRHMSTDETHLRRARLRSRTTHAPWPANVEASVQTENPEGAVFTALCLRLSEACVSGLLVNSWTRLQEVSQRRRKSWIKLIFCFLCTQKLFSSIHKIQIEPQLLGSQWDSHKPPSFHPKYLKLCSENERSFYGFGTTWG